MARAPVEQVRCDRCKTVTITPVPETPKQGSDLVVEFMGKQLVFGDLCPRCQKTVENLFEDMKEWKREVKQGFLGPKVPPDTAPPVSSPPDYSPPKPHAKAAGDR